MAHFHFTYDPNVSLEQRLGFELAAAIWSQFLLDDVTINLHIVTADNLNNGQAVGGAIPLFHEQNYGVYQEYVKQDATSAEDDIVIASQQDGNTVDVLIGNEVVDGNSTIMLTSAQAKALGMEESIQLENDTVWNRDLVDPNALDGYILINNSFDWSYDFTRQNEVPENTLDFLTMALHEIGHALGFVSGLDGLMDVVELYSGQTQAEGFTPLDLLRYSDASQALSNPDGQVADLTVGTEANFSLDGETNLATFSTGQDASAGGDGYQASHWERFKNALGIMDPTLGYQERTDISHLDLQAFDVLGWDINYSILDQGLDWSALYDQAIHSVATDFGIDSHSFEAAIANNEDSYTLGYSRWWQDFAEHMSALGYSRWWQEFEAAVLELGYSRWWQALEQPMQELGYSRWWQAFEELVFDLGYSRWWQDFEHDMHELGYSRWWQGFEVHQSLELGYSRWWQDFEDHMTALGYSRWWQDFETDVLKLGYSRWWQALEEPLMELGYSRWWQAFEELVVQLGYSHWWQDFEHDMLSLGYSRWWQGFEEQVLELGYSRWWQEVDPFLATLEKVDGKVTEENAQVASGGVNGSNTEIFYGGAEDDIIAGDGKQDRINAGDGDDLLDGKAGHDVLWGEGGRDLIYGQRGNDLIYGGADDDLLMGEADEDELYGEAGNDILSGGQGHDILSGGDGRDDLKGGTGRDVLSGDTGNDRLKGESNNDIVIGGAGRDQVDGNSGHDLLYGDTYLGEETLKQLKALLKQQPIDTNSHETIVVPTNEALNPIRVEAEAMTLSGDYTFRTDWSNDSGDTLKVLSTATGTTTFTGPSGNYMVVARYHDESDPGNATLDFSLNGTLLNSFVLDQNTQRYYTRTVVQNLALMPGDVLSVVATADGSDNANLDYLEFVPLDNLIVTQLDSTESASIAETTTTTLEGNTLRVEAESMLLVGDYSPSDYSFSSGGQLIALSNQGQGKAITTFTGETGFYDVVVGYHDERGDGIAHISAVLDGIELDSWLLDQNLDSKSPTVNNLINRTVASGVALSSGDIFELVGLRGEGDEDELARIDYVEFVQVEAPSLQEPVTFQTSTQFLHVVNDGGQSAAVSRSTLPTNGTFDATLLNAESGLGFRALDIATADGETFYELYNDGNDSAAFYEFTIQSDNTFSWTLLNNNSGFHRSYTLGLATADGETFYQLYDDGTGTAKSYRAIRSADNTFSWQLLSDDSGISLNALALSTIDGQLFNYLEDNGDGTVSLYEATLQSDGTFDSVLLDANTNVSNQFLGQAAWGAVEAVLDTSQNLNLVAHWSFDELDGTVVADQTDTHHATLTNTVTDGSQWGVGVIDGALQLDGVNDYVSVANSDAINLGTHGQRTISLWFHVDDAAIADRKQVLYEEGGTDRGLNIYIHDGKLYVGGWNNDNNQSGWTGTFLETDDIVADEWHHVALVLDGDSEVRNGALTGYLDGEVFGIGAGSQLWQHTDDIAFGAVGYTTRFHDGTVSGTSSHGFAGYLDDAYLYNQALNIDEIRDLIGQDNDQIQGGTGNDIAFGGAGNDVIYGESETDISSFILNGTQSYNGHTYLLSQVGTWQEAQAQARQLGGNLVTINDAVEESWLQQRFGTDNLMWIGLTDQRVEGEWEWISGEPSDYTNWATNEPNNGGTGEDYAVMNRLSANQWDDRGWSNHLYQGIIELNSTNHDTLFGDRGNDTIYGNAGDDALYGDDLNTALSEGLVVHWDFDEGSGNSAGDESGHTNTGWLWGNTSWTDGRSGGAVDLSGFDAGVSAIDAPVLDIEHQITLASWINADSFDGWDGIITKGTSSSPYALQLHRNESSEYYLRFTANWGSPSGGIGGGTWDSHTQLDLNQWQHVAATYDGEAIRFYIDGQLDSNVVYVDLKFGTNNEDLVVGADLPGNDEYFDGAIDDVRVYNRAISAVELAALTTGDNLQPDVVPQFMHLFNDGNNTAALYEDTLQDDGIFNTSLINSDSDLGRKTIGLATADGEVFYQLLDDKTATAALYEARLQDDGTFDWTLRNNNSELGRKTLGLATVDGQTFYQILDDSEGSAALYETELQDDGTFNWTLLNADSNIGRGALSLSTTDGKTFYHLQDDGSGSASLWRSTLQSNGTFSNTLLSDDSDISRNALGQVAWDPNAPLNESNDDHLIGGVGNDALIGGAGNDTLNGTDSIAVGFLEIDALSGGAGADTFILGDARQAYYQGMGDRDYALIQDFNSVEDRLQLHGSTSTYSQQQQGSDLHLYYEDNGSDLVAIFEQNTALDLNTVGLFS